MDEKNFYAWHEGDMSRMERSNKRLWVIILVLIGALVGSNLAWVIYESQFETVVTQIEAEQESEGDGSNYVTGGDFYEPTESESNN